MKVSDAGEGALVQKIRALFSSRSEGVELGIGDDAAILAPSDKSLIATTDIMSEGVHFDLSMITPRQLGYKLVAVNASDLYAMRAHPKYLLLDLALPGDFEVEEFDEFLGGLKEGLDEHAMALVGGDFSAAKLWASISATALGLSEKPLRRSGAKEGDGIYITGPLGLSACGLGILKKIKRRVELDKPFEAPLPWEVMEPCLRRHLVPSVSAHGDMVNNATAMMDISDGLGIDLSRLCAESGVGAVVDEASLPIPEALVKTCEFLGTKPLDMIISGGEDYELLFTAPRGDYTGAIEVGTVLSKGLFIDTVSGGRETLSPGGYMHFR